MTRVGYLVLALLIVVGAFAMIYRATEPLGRGLQPGEVQATDTRERDLRDSGISRTAEKERRLMLMLKADRDGTDRAEIASDPELQRIIRLCRRWARTDAERQLAESLALPLESLPMVK